MDIITPQISKIQDNNKIPHKSHEHCLALLGNQEKVTKCSNFYKENNDILDTILAGLVTDYLLKDDEVDSKQAKAFKDGVFLFANFFKQCKIETDIRNDSEKEGEIETIKG